MAIQSEFYAAIKEHYPATAAADALDQAMRQTPQEAGYTAGPEPVES